MFGIIVEDIKLVASFSIHVDSLVDILTVLTFTKNHKKNAKVVIGSQFATSSIPNFQM